MTDVISQYPVDIWQLGANISHLTFTGNSVHLPEQSDIYRLTTYIQEFAPIPVFFNFVIKSR